MSIRAVMANTGLFEELNNEVFEHCVMGGAKAELIGKYQDIAINSAYALLEDIQHVRQTFLCNFNGRLAAVIPYQETLQYGELHYVL